MSLLTNPAFMLALKNAYQQKYGAGGATPNPMLGAQPAPAAPAQSKPHAPTGNLNAFIQGFAKMRGMGQPQTPQSVTQAPGWSGNFATQIRPFGSSYGG